MEGSVGGSFSGDCSETLVPSRGLSGRLGTPVSVEGTSEGSTGGRVGFTCGIGHKTKGNTTQQCYTSNTETDRQTDRQTDRDYFVKPVLLSTNS